MYLTAYHFAGDPAELLQGHDRLIAAIPAENVDLHIVVAGERGITVLDACPTREVFEEFSTSPAFLAAVAGAGLPTPTVQPLGDIVGSTQRSTEMTR